MKKFARSSISACSSTSSRTCLVFQTSDTTVTTVQNTASMTAHRTTGTPEVRAAAVQLPLSATRPSIVQCPVARLISPYYVKNPGDLKDLRVQAQYFALSGSTQRTPPRGSSLSPR